MTACTTGSFPGCGGHRAFALITALALMAFLLLLLVSLGSLLQLEIQSGTQTRHQQEAKQNARYALIEAIGQLQQHAGPDRRITARADIREDVADTARYWTGIWNSGGNALNQRRIDDSDFRLWLVSMGDSEGQPLVLQAADDADDPAASTYLAEAWERITLVGPGSSNEPPVEVGLVALGEKGAYGWWVSDEGIKAKVSVTDPYQDAAVDTPDHTKRLRSAQQFGLPDRFTEPPTDGWRERTMWFHDPEFFHDLTTQGYGVLADVTRGELRRDLTLAFSSGNEAIFNDYLNAQFFRDDPAFNNIVNFVLGGVYNGPGWNLLRDYHQSHRRILADGSFNESWDNDGAHAAHLTISLNFNDPEFYLPGNAVNALDARRQLNFSIRFELIPEEDDSGAMVDAWYPILRVAPVAVLYNPYSIPLNIREGEIHITVNPLVELSIDGGEPVSFHLFELFPPRILEVSDDGQTIVDGQGFRKRVIYPAMTLQPGESRIMSLDPDSTGNLMRGGRYRFDDEGNRIAEPGAYTLDLYSDTNEIDAFELPVKAEWVVEADTEGPSDAKAATSMDAAFGLTDSELRRLRADSPDASVEVRITFNDFDSHYHRSRIANSSGTLLSRNTQRFRMEFGLDGQSMAEAPADNEWIFYPSLEHAEDAAAIAVWRVGLRTIAEPAPAPDDQINLPLRWIDGNFRAVNYAVDPLEANTALIAVPPVSTYGNPRGRIVPADPGVEGHYDGNTYQGFWGNDIGSAGVRHVILFDLPREPLLSLGALQHANLGRYSHQPLYVVGNSYMPLTVAPHLPWRNVQRGTTRYLHLDMPYLVNRILWDRYFFSSLPQDIDALEDFVSGTTPLPNSRLVPFSTNGPTDVDSLRYTGDTGVFERVAGALMLNGAFNINSTSVSAWEALLNSTADLELPLYRPLDGGRDGVNSGDGPVFTRFSRNFDTGDEPENELFAGARRLSLEQTRALAGEIVRQVKLRGPFGSVADFVNRTLAPLTDERSKSGALQAAIDAVGYRSGDSVEPINQAADAISTATPRNYLDGGDDPREYSAADGLSIPALPQATGAPGYLLQGDLLQVLGPVLAARSDTFVVRAYGDVRNPLNGAVVARAWCEAVVQRIPEALEIPDGSSPEQERIAPEGEFGRAFQVVAFRWLDEEQI